MDNRQTKGFEITQQKGVKEIKNDWLVKSQSNMGFYRVSDTFICDCSDSELHKTTCKYAYAVRYYLDIEKHTLEGIKDEKIRLTYKQACKVYNEAQTQEGKLFDELLHDLVSTIETHLQLGRERPRLLMREEIFVTMKKIYSGMSSRRAVSLFEDAVDKGYITHKPHFNTVSEFLNREDVTPILEELIKITAAPLKVMEENFAIDSTGFRTTSFSRYAEDKHGIVKERKWIKAHICCGTKMHVVTAAKITDEFGGDSPQFASLTKETMEARFKIKEVYADKAYSRRDNLAFVDRLGAVPYVPFRSSSGFRPFGAPIWKKMYYYFNMNQEEFIVHYNQRSNVESTMAAIKRKLGETLKSKKKRAQINELLCKLIAYNITVLIHEMKELGIEPNLRGSDGQALL